MLKFRATLPKVKPSDFIFANPDTGEPWVDFRKAWRRALVAAGIPERKGLNLYSLRHTFATHYLEGGGAITDLRSQLGHSDISTTQIYAALVDSRRRDSVFALRFKRDAEPPGPVGSTGEMNTTKNTTGPSGDSGSVKEEAA